jgi:hypothetical protein
MKILALVATFNEAANIQRLVHDILKGPINFTERRASHARLTALRS